MKRILSISKRELDHNFLITHPRLWYILIISFAYTMAKEK